MLRIVYIGMETRILDKLRHCRVHLTGAYLPPAHYWVRKKLPFLSKFPWIIRKFFKKVAVYGYLSDFLENNQIPVLKCKNIHSGEFIAMLRQLQPDLGIVANFGQFLNASILEIPKFGFINMHPSLLPRYRGPEPFGHTLLHGEKTSGVTWYQMTTQLDQGDVLAQAAFPVASHETIKGLEAKAVDLAIRMMEPLLEEIENGTVQRAPQNEAEATYFPRLTKKQKAHLKAMGTG